MVYVQRFLFFFLVSISTLRVYAGDVDGRCLLMGQSFALEKLLTNNTYRDATDVVRKTVEAEDTIIYGALTNLGPGLYYLFENGEVQHFGPPPTQKQLLPQTDTWAKERQAFASKTYKKDGNQIKEVVIPLFDENGEKIGILRYGLLVE